MDYQPNTLIEGYSGLLFIGDTHIASRKPGRRVDNYAAACLDKLTQIAGIAQERNLYPVHLGDLFHRASENNLELLTSLMQVLRGYRVPLPVLAGSHDRTESWFTGKDAAQLMEDAGCVSLLEAPGRFASLIIKGERVNLWAAPAGAPLPDVLSPEVPGTNILISHHDLDFTGPYPGSAPLHEIEGCVMLVNGHMHTPTRPVIKGQTVCFNPGSTMRVSVDQRDYRPGVSVWEPGLGRSLERVELKFAPNVFDLTGKEVFAADPKALAQATESSLTMSTFASKLRAVSGSLGASRTADGEVLREELATYFEAGLAAPAVKKHLLALLDGVLQESAAA